MAVVFQFKTGEGEPSSLRQGEPAFDKENNIFYIGDENGYPVRIGFDYFIINMSYISDTKASLDKTYGQIKEAIENNKIPVIKFKTYDYVNSLDDSEYGYLTLESIADHSLAFGGVQGKYGLYALVFEYGGCTVSKMEFITKSKEGCVLSINGQTGDVILGASDVGAVSTDSINGIIKSVTDYDFTNLYTNKADKVDVYTKEEVDSKLSSVYRYKGTVDGYSLLPTDVEIGDVYNIKNSSDMIIGQQKILYGYSFDNHIPPFSYLPNGVQGLYIEIQMTPEEADKYIAEGKIKVSFFEKATAQSDDPMISFEVPIVDAKGFNYMTSGAIFEGITPFITQLFIVIISNESPFSDAPHHNIYDYQTFFEEINGHFNDYPNPSVLQINDYTKTVTIAPMINAGDNVAWNGSEWDILSGTVDMSNYYTKDEINSKLASVYKYKGSVSVDALDALKYISTLTSGDVYNVTSSGTVPDYELTIMADVVSADADGLAIIVARDSSLNDAQQRYNSNFSLLLGASDTYNIVGTGINSDTNTVQFFVLNSGLSVGDSRPIGYFIKGFEVVAGDNVAWDGIYWDILAGTITASNIISVDENGKLVININGVEYKLTPDNM